MYTCVCVLTQISPSLQSPTIYTCKASWVSGSEPTGTEEHLYIWFNPNAEHVPCESVCIEHYSAGNGTILPQGWSVDSSIINQALFK